MPPTDLRLRHKLCILRTSGSADRNWDGEEAPGIPGSVLFDESLHLLRGARHTSCHTGGFVFL